MPRRVAKPKSRPKDLKEACVVAAHAVIAEKGVDGLSLRDVARRLGVSHQAPYRHYESRDHLLAEVIRRGLERFAEHLEARPRHPDPEKDMGALGEAYLRYARENPLEYRLLFGMRWPDVARNPELLANAIKAFDILRQTLGRLPQANRRSSDQLNLDALFVWSVMHGQSTLLQTNAFENLNLPGTVVSKAAAHILGRIGDALGGHS